MLSPMELTFVLFILFIFDYNGRCRSLTTYSIRKYFRFYFYFFYFSQLSIFLFIRHRFSFSSFLKNLCGPGSDPAAAGTPGSWIRDPGSCGRSLLLWHIKNSNFRKRPPIKMKKIGTWELSYALYVCMWFKALDADMAIELSHHQTVGVENKLLHQLSIKRRVYQWQRSNCCTKHSLKTLQSEMCIPSADVFIVCSADPRKNELQICRIMARITHPASFQINYMVYTYLATNRFTFTPISYFLSSFFCGVRPSDPMGYGVHPVPMTVGLREFEFQSPINPPSRKVTLLFLSTLIFHLTSMTSSFILIQDR